ncbi:hypothetical protein JK202_05035 [Gluconobacter sp. Dm-62]|nr:hypothetical protein [Gluconobacter sp. Dm-62]MBS1102383.1 hypothetical protein [Gluconobacter sp. Dm-62]
MIVANAIPKQPRTWLRREAEGKGCTVLDKTLDAGVMEKIPKDIFDAA